MIEQNSLKIKDIINDYKKKPSISQNEVSRRTQLFNELTSSENIIKSQYNSIVADIKIVNFLLIKEQTRIIRNDHNYA